MTHETILFIRVFGVIFVICGILYKLGFRKVIDPSLLLFYFFYQIVKGKDQATQHRKNFFQPDSIRKYASWIIIGGLYFIIYTLLVEKI